LPTAKSPAAAPGLFAHYDDGVYFGRARGWLTAQLHNWTFYPAGSGGYYMDYASGAAFVAGQARAGDGIVYQAEENGDRWLMVGYGLQAAGFCT